MMQTTIGACETCPAGFYCPPNSPHPVRCPNGYACDANTGADLSTKKCPAGKYSGGFSLSDSANCLTCWDGYVCPEQSAFPVPCDAGKILTTNPGTDASTDCTDHTANQPQPFYGIGSDRSDTGLYCAPGYMCPAGTKWPREFPCAAGTYSDSISITLQSECQPCPEGYYCEAGTNTLTNPKKICPAGYYCDASS